MNASNRHSKTKRCNGVIPFSTTIPQVLRQRQTEAEEVMENATGHEASLPLPCLGTLTPLNLSLRLRPGGTLPRGERPSRARLQQEESLRKETAANVRTHKRLQ